MSTPRKYPCTITRVFGNYLTTQTNKIFEKRYKIQSSEGEQSCSRFKAENILSIIQDQKKDLSISKYSSSDKITQPQIEYYKNLEWKLENQNYPEHLLNPDIKILKTYISEDFPELFTYVGNSFDGFSGGPIIQFSNQNNKTTAKVLGIHNSTNKRFLILGSAHNGKGILNEFREII